MGPFARLSYTFHVIQNDDLGLSSKYSLATII